jgi:hypothetical protein
VAITRTPAARQKLTRFGRINGRIKGAVRTKQYRRPKVPANRRRTYFSDFAEKKWPINANLPAIIDHLSILVY